MTPTFVLYLITLNAVTGAEVSRQPAAPVRDTEQACVQDQMRERPQRAYIANGKAQIDVYECVRRDEVSKL